MINFIIRTGQLMLWAHVLIIAALGWTILAKDMRKFIRSKKETALPWHMRLIRRIRRKETVNV